MTKYNGELLIDLGCKKIKIYKTFWGELGNWNMVCLLDDMREFINFLRCDNGIVMRIIFGVAC